MIKKILFFILVCFCLNQVSLKAIDDCSELDGVTVADLEAWENANLDLTTRGGLSVDLPTIALLLGSTITEPLWQSTLAPKGRDILYQLPHKITALEYGGLALSLFFNMTDKLPVSVRSLLDVEGMSQQNTLASFIALVIGQTSPGVSVSEPEIMGLLPLLTGITIQERKGGTFLQGGFLRGPFSIQVQTSIQFSERNFWLNKVDEQAVKAFSNRLYPGQELDQHEFYKLSYGMGDTRLKVGMNTLNLTNFQMDVGVEAIFPTSRFAAKQKQISNIASESDLMSLTGDAEVFVSLLKGARDYLLNPQFGNGGHFGFGCYFESKVGIFHNLAQIWTRLSYDFLFEGDEARLIMYKVAIQPTDLITAASGPSADVAQVLVSYFQQYLFPSSFKVNVKPGGILNFVTSLNVDVDKWRFALGYDFYAQQQEYITEVYNTNVAPGALRIDDAESGPIKQHKVFAEAMRFKKWYKTDLGIGFGGDTTIYSKGLGYDWTLYLKFAASF